MEKELEEWYKLHQFHLYTGSYETKDLADFLKVTPRTVQRWLKEKTKPSKEQLAVIKRYLVQLAQKEPNISL
ncbi:MAG: helix-turn-helix transcriptional regulator [Candidatus Omnitrophota bacterium]|nr:helix-turn-helix transcriptional regulator [Candidatus Omnitrophota bacterium]